MAERPLVLVTRPEPGASRFASDLRAMCPTVEVAVSPVLSIVFGDAPEDLGSWSTLLFTSSNGVRAVGGWAQGMTAFCVGEATTDAARRAGMAARMAGQDVAGMIDALIKAPPATPCLHLRGAHARGDLAATLTGAGIETTDRVVYDQVAQPLTDAARQAIRSASGVILPIFSPRTAQVLSDDMRGVSAPLTIIAMSDAVARAWAGPSAARMILCRVPDAEAMLQETAAACSDALP